MNIQNFLLIRRKPTYNNVIWITIIFICAYGLMMVFSASSFVCASSAKYNFDPRFLFNKQLIMMAFGLAACFFLQFVNYGLLYPLAIAFYLLGLAGIPLLHTGMGVTVNGATRWIRLFGLQFQVAEIIKIGVIFIEAFMVHKFKNSLSSGKLLAYMWGTGMGAAIVLWRVSNDLSSAAVILLITFGITFIYTNRFKTHLVFAGLSVGAAFFKVYSIWKNMPTPEQLENMSFRDGRIAAWLDPMRYADGAGYQTAQALYAIGRGGFFGQGLGKSVQKLSSIPEAQNDMIFAIICEELGVFGAVILIFLFIYLMYYMIRIAANANTIFGSALVTGVIMHIGIQVVMNIAVNLNVFPNTGIALPFISYGGTAVFCQLLEVSLVLSVGRTSAKIEEKTNNRASNVKNIASYKKSREA